MVNAYFSFSPLKATKCVIDGGPLGSDWWWRGERGGSLFRVFPGCPVIAWRQDQKQSPEAAEPGNRCRKIQSLLQKLRRGAVRHQRTDEARLA